MYLQCVSDITAFPRRIMPSAHKPIENMIPSAPIEVPPTMITEAAEERTPRRRQRMEGAQVSPFFLLLLLLLLLPLLANAIPPRPSSFPPPQARASAVGAGGTTMPWRGRPFPSFSASVLASATWSCGIVTRGGGGGDGDSDGGCDSSVGEEREPCDSDEDTDDAECSNGACESEDDEEDGRGLSVDQEKGTTLSAANKSLPVKPRSGKRSRSRGNGKRREREGERRKQSKRKVSNKRGKRQRAEGLSSSLSGGDPVAKRKLGKELRRSIDTDERDALITRAEWWRALVSGTLLLAVLVGLTRTMQAAQLQEAATVVDAQATSS